MLDGSGFELRWETRDFLSSQLSRPTLRPSQPSINATIRLMERDVGHPSPSGAEVKMDRAAHALPSVSE
jgi:hypothetical protein